MIRLNVKNIKNVQKAISNYGSEATDIIADVIYKTSHEIEVEAKRLAPVDDGDLQKSIRTERQKDDFHYRVTAYMPYSAFQEFGTGGLINVPTEWAQKASRFRGKGIKKVNMSPQPFMYPAYVRGRTIFNRDMRNELNDLAKRFNNG